ncbi:hypothetical protein Dsin_007867 [Dipteronia sinensis]|uniref:Uncharacterized protein n=1 Tax=Dipteronia sinensis TaxID=43782 RepID=A0AAE0B2E9_9ROSI|nr:hypothetical protein Dsin_007867 [Dipteronia sinensis]
METQHKQETVPAHVAMVPTPGMGHLIPLVELAKRLVLHHNFRVTFIVPNDGTSMKTQKKLLESLPESLMISTVFLPPVSFDDLPGDVKIETRITLSLTRSLSAFRDSLKVLARSTRLVALVVDLFGVAAFEVAREFNLPPYIFFPTTAMLLSFIFLSPEFDEKFTCEYKDMTEPLQIPGSVPVHGRDIADPLQDKKDEAYKWVLYLAKSYPSASGFMVNSFIDLESGAFKALMEGEVGFGVPVYPVGPLVQTGSRNIDQVALRVQVDENGLVGRDDIAKYVRGLIEGGEGKLLKNNMRKLKDSAAIVLSQDGSSAKSLAKVAEIWKNQEKIGN